MKKTAELPAFSQIRLENIVPQVKAFIDAAHETVARLCQVTEPSWQNILQLLEDLFAQESILWSPIRHLNNVMSTPELRKVHDEALTLWTEYHNFLGQHTALYQIIRKIKNSPAFETLSKAQKMVISHQLRDFHLSGVDLDADKKARYQAISEELTALCTQFGANVLDATQAYTHPIHSPEELSGLPQWLIEAAKEKAAEKNQSTPLLTLAQPIYSAVMQFADHRPLREDMYVAYVTRASELGPFAKQWDNGPLIDKILKLRAELADLLSFNNYAELSLATKMASSTEEVLSFLNELAAQGTPLATQEMMELQLFAKEQGLNSPLQPWDIAYYSEKLRQEKYDYNSETLRHYFPLPKVLDGLLSLLEKLFSIQFTQHEKFDTWHSDALLYSIKNKKGDILAYLYLDLYARSTKQQGAWADECRPRYKDAAGNSHVPVSFVVCNFSRPSSETPSLLTHEDIMTLFHEFGHALHHSLTEIDEPSVSGTHGVAWDAVEFPSQFMENWCWSQEVLTALSGHYQSKEPLPYTLYQKLLSSKYYHCGLDLVRQLEFALFDFRIHLNCKDKNLKFVQSTLNEVRKQVAVISIPDYHRFQNSFTHIFDGGYDAGYYSYKWAEVLSADAFQRFAAAGLYDTALGLEFKNKILSRGGSEEAMDLFVEFMGRKPKIDALLVSLGIKAP